jgi:two-component system, OmpR family, phosphate regulon response regulator PhoB
MFDMDPQNKALIVEDEAAIANLLKIHLREAGFEVDSFGDAESAFAAVQIKNYNLCLLDWMLPGVQGIDFLKRVRPHNQNLKVLMLTAKADPESIVQGLEAGADDYLTKPFDAKVFAARVRNLMRRSEYENQIRQQNQSTPNYESSIEEMTIDKAHIHFTKYYVKNNGIEVHLTPSEFKLLASLFKAQGQVLTREQLIDQIQGVDVSVTGRTIDTHIFALRKKMGDWAAHIETIRGVGYRILISADDVSENLS